MKIYLVVDYIDEKQIAYEDNYEIVPIMAFKKKDKAQRFKDQLGYFDIIEIDLRE